MNYLLDTHTVLWSGSMPGRVGESAIQACRDEESVLYISVVSLWEIAIKSSLGKLKLPHSLEKTYDSIFRCGFVLLPIKLPHLLRIAELPWHHRDPFDRMIVAQSFCEDMPVLSADSEFEAYGVSRIW